MEKMLTSAQKMALRKKAHSLSPVVLLGAKGLTEAVEKEIGLALEIHELIKVKVPEQDKSVRDEIVSRMVSHTNATLIQRVGHIVVLYKKRAKSTL